MTTALEKDTYDGPRCEHCGSINVISSGKSLDKKILMPNGELLIRLGGSARKVRCEDCGNEFAWHSPRSTTPYKTEGATAETPKAIEEPTISDRWLEPPR